MNYTQSAWLLLAALGSICLAGCGQSPATNVEPTSVTHRGNTRPTNENSPAGGSNLAEPVGVLLVNHGSHSARWRAMLSDVESDVRERVLAIDGIGTIKTAFMEYTEPSIATQLKALDAEGYSDVILVPLLLTVSSHSFDDIPTIYGAKADAKSLAALTSEGIDRYTPKARVTMTPLLDFARLLETNLVRRIKAISRDADQEGVVLVAYGSEPYDAEWNDLFERLHLKVAAETGIAPSQHCWCGHIVHYSKEPTQKAVRSVLAEKEQALVIPALVAQDEAFQHEIIGNAIEEMDESDRVRYVPDSILPDNDLNDWIVDIVTETHARLAETDEPAGDQP